jgi:hypothetical protein
VSLFNPAAYMTSTRLLTATRSILNIVRLRHCCISLAERPREMENKESFPLRHSKCATPGLLQNQTRTITVAVTAHQKFVNMKTGTPQHSLFASDELNCFHLFHCKSNDEHRFNGLSKIIPPVDIPRSHENRTTTSSLLPRCCACSWRQ